MNQDDNVVSICVYKYVTLEISSGFIRECHNMNIIVQKPVDVNLTLI